MYLNTRIFPTTGYARVLLFMFLRRELGGTGTGCLFQFTYCVDMYTAMVYSNTTVGVILGYAVPVFVGFLRIQLRSSSIQR